MVTSCRSRDHFVFPLQLFAEDANYSAKLTYIALIRKIKSKLDEWKQQRFALSSEKATFIQ